MERARVVLVTNVGQGFGRAIALAYGRAGYDVVCADRDVDLATKTAAELEELGGQAIPIQADMTTQMDVMAAYHKVMEIFGELGGVVHIAGQVSSTPFENLAEGEYFELMAEDVRSSYLVLKTAARLRSVGWIVVVAPPDLGSVQMLSVQGALERMTEGFMQRYAFPRANLVIPSRQASDPRHDQALVRAVRYFGSQESAGVSGQVMRVELPAPPSATDSLLPEVRAALALGPSLDESPYDPWSLEPLPAEGPHPNQSSSGALSSAAARARAAAESARGGQLAAGPSGVEPGTRVTESLQDGGAWEAESLLERAAGRPGDYTLDVETDYSDDTSDDADETDDYDGLDTDEDESGAYAFGRAQGSGEDSYSEDDFSEDEEDDYEQWGRELGLPPGSPALRHLIGEDSRAFAPTDEYVAGLESAVDLYGDLSRLEASEVGEFVDPSDEAGFEEVPHSVHLRGRRRS